MNLEQLKKDETLVEYIRKFVRDERFLVVKDAFVAHTPEKAETETTVSVLFGKGLGTRYAFNEMETIANQPPPTTKTEKPKGQGKDPDLDA